MSPVAHDLSARQIRLFPFHRSLSFRHESIILVFALFFSAGLGSAQTVFPGLKAVLSAAEWKRAGLDRLSPDEIGVIDAALIRHEAGVTSQLQGELTTARESVAAGQGATPTATAEQKRGWLRRFGLPVLNDSDWRSLPPLKAKVVAWEAANRFKLDNGQVWEGSEPITYELVGKSIEIQARPNNHYDLVVDGKNTTLRVIRLR